jgi:hypothetical protein
MVPSLPPEWFLPYLPVGSDGFSGPPAGLASGEADWQDGADPMTRCVCNRDERIFNLRYQRGFPSPPERLAQP